MCIRFPNFLYFQTQTTVRTGGNIDNNLGQAYLLWINPPSPEPDDTLNI